MPEMPPEEDVIGALTRAGIARPIYEHARAGKVCKNTGCRETVPQNSHKSLNLGAESGFCSVGCLMEFEDKRNEDAP